MHKYFVVITIKTNSGEEILSNADVKLDGPITCFDNVREMEDIVKKDNPDFVEVIITNYILMGTSDKVYDNN